MAASSMVSSGWTFPPKPFHRPSPKPLFFSPSNTWPGFRTNSRVSSLLGGRFMLSMTGLRILHVQHWYRRTVVILTWTRYAPTRPDRNGRGDFCVDTPRVVMVVNLTSQNKPSSSHSSTLFTVSLVHSRQNGFHRRRSQRQRGGAEGDS